ncbi:HNH endonuclease signature motif containing protein [Streptomyces sp. ZAF1911]|uniref:HNH endonuclease signature motif containing protein n=1 Tax=Streptomyces sp. ZAF1911 TaxID=2944129 RepID=UPI00237C0B34|nr:HNH endonuclease signature motif containing protein [Streptomyces sp. ZAF1911]MDD9382363.1 HNH endonuclease signature motif containing protein [Streptomyces sp. ZAF1911]
MSRPGYNHELLARNAPEARSLVDLLRRLGVPVASGPRTYLRNRLAHYGIETSHFVDEPLPARVPQSYSKDRLAEAAATSHSIAEMLVAMGVTPYNSAFGHLRKKLDQFGIDTSHFTTQQRRQDPLFPREEITRAVSESRSMSGVMRSLGQPEFGGAGRAKARRSIEEYGISTAHFTGQGHAVGCPSPARRRAEDVLQLLEAGSSREKTVVLRRALDDLGVPHLCNECGTGDTWRGKRLVLEIDHINGDRLDNRRDNLRYLCPSCHSQTMTFSNRSRPRNTPVGTVK